MNELQKTAQWLSEFWGEFAKGGKDVYYRFNTKFKKCGNFPTIHSVKENWQLRPIAKKPVDLSVLIKSGIDCEFSDNKFYKRLGELNKIDKGYYDELLDVWWSYCRPRMNHWHSWQGGECPLPDNVVVEFWLRGDSSTKGNDVCEVTDLIWKWACEDTDIIAFRVIGLADGYCWPWECDS